MPGRIPKASATLLKTDALTEYQNERSAPRAPQRRGIGPVFRTEELPITDLEQLIAAASVIADQRGRFDWAKAVTLSELWPKTVERLRCASAFEEFILLSDRDPKVNQMGQLTPGGLRLGTMVRPALQAMKDRPRPLWRLNRSPK